MPVEVLSVEDKEKEVLKIFLLTVTILFLISRIKNTPGMLSKKLYFKKIEKAIESNNKSFNGKSDDEVNILKGTAIIILLLFQMFYIIYYMIIGCRYQTELILILTALQIITVIITTKRAFTDKLFSQNIEDYKFYRWFFLSNIVLDYVYYPLTIYMLLK